MLQVSYFAKRTLGCRSLQSRKKIPFLPAAAESLGNRNSKQKGLCGGFIGVFKSMHESYQVIFFWEEMGLVVVTLLNEK